MKSIKIYIILIFGSLQSLVAQDFSIPVSEEIIQTKSYSGIWIRTYPDSVILKVEDYSSDTVEFHLISLNGKYAGYIGEDRLTPKKLARIDGNALLFNDTLAECDGYPLYYAGEQPCKLLFKIIDDQTIEVNEENCYMIYGGAGVTWGGLYRRNPDGIELEHDGFTILN
jgi:hypothetical protein